MKKVILFSLLFLLSCSLLAQKKGYEWGYIITEKGDTLEGWVNDRTSGTFNDIHTKIRFKQEDKLFKKKYSSNDILGYGYLGIHFVSIPLLQTTEFFKTRYYIRPGGQRRFLRVIERNECLNHYEVEFVQDDSFTIDTYPLFHIPGSREMVRVTQGILGLKEKRLTEYFSDCHDLIIAIDSEEITNAQEVYNFYCKHCK